MIRFLLFIPILFLMTMSGLFATETKSIREPEPYTRIGGSMAEPEFETAVRRFINPDTTRPDIFLVGVVHIGERTYYQTLQKILDKIPLVLFECASRPDFVRMSAETDTQKILRTKKRMSELAELSAQHYLKSSIIPTSSVMLKRNLIRFRNTIQTIYLDTAQIDDWGRPLQWKIEALRLILRSQGPDDTTDHDDIVITYTPSNISKSIESYPLPLKLARALQLKYQLNEIRYDRPHFEHCDASLAELKAESSTQKTKSQKTQKETVQNNEKSANESNMDILFGADNTSIKIFESMLAYLSTRPDYREEAKSIMMNMLDRVDYSKPFLDGRDDMLIHRRNAIVLTRLDTIRKEKTPSVAVFYGAAHLHAMEKELLQKGYQLKETVWLSAMKSAKQSEILKSRK